MDAIVYDEEPEFVEIDGCKIPFAEIKKGLDDIDHGRVCEASVVMEELRNMCK